MAGRASGFVAFNSFVGMVAFGGAAPNRLNGVQITATGGDNLIRTCLVAGNLGNGIVIGGNATVSNGLNGISVAGNSRGTVIAANSIVDSGVNGILLNAATDLLVGGTTAGAGSAIATSGGYGLYAVGTCSRTRVARNRIVQNALGNVNIASATGIVYVP